MSFFLRSWVGLLLSFVILVPTSFGLTCKEVRELTGLYFKMHFSLHNFDDELSRRTLENFIKAWDPGKVYFLKPDIDRFQKAYATKLDDMILDENCKAIDDVMNVYSKRFSERLVLINKLIDDKHDFTLDEYMMIERKNMVYAPTTEEVTERWRKRIKFSLLQLNRTLEDLKKSRNKIKKRYELATKRHNELTSDDVYSTFLNAFSAALDPHTTYYGPEALEDFRIQTRLSLEGIGAVLRSEDGFTTIQELVAGGAAIKTNRIKVEDKIIAVAQGSEPPVDVIDMDLREVVKLIRGTRGTEVRLTLVREEGGKNTQLVVPIIRETIKLEDRAAQSVLHEVEVKEKAGMPARTVKIGVIDLPSFYMDFEGRQSRRKNYKSSSRDMQREIEKLKKQKVDAIVVDLRSNGGGALDESIKIAGLFFDKGPVVQIRDQRGKTYVQEDEDPRTYYKGPLALLISRQSASASEILAGAIQDYGRGLIIGDSHTFGKGTVQNLNDVDPKLGAIKVTISKFYRPSGSSTQLRGVESDVVLPSLIDQYELGEKHYDYALPWEKITASSYKRSRMVTPYLRKLKEASKKRVAIDEGFDKIRKAIKEYRAGEAERSRVSLKLDKSSDKSKDDKTKPEPQKEDKPKSDKPTDAEKLADDIHLQETLKIAADYVQLINKRALGDVTLVALKKPATLVQKTEKGGDKSADKLDASPQVKAPALVQEEKQDAAKGKKGEKAVGDK